VCNRGKPSFLPSHTATQKKEATYCSELSLVLPNWRFLKLPLVLDRKVQSFETVAVKSPSSPFHTPPVSQNELHRLALIIPLLFYYKIVLVKTDQERVPGDLSSLRYCASWSPYSNTQKKSSQK
jgi:hypothetical protein